LPLTVSNGSSIGYVSAEGHWRPTDNAPDKQLVNKIAVKLRCEREQHVCREIDASLFMGVLTPDLTEYEISSWTDTGIVADASDDSECGIGHRLSIDFKANSVIVTDYPKKVGGKNFAGVPCKAFQNANSYILSGGDILLYGQNTIFSCTGDGASSAIIAKVKEFHGDVGDKAYPLSYPVVKLI